MRADTQMKGSKNQIKPDLGVSETIGFIIIFGITITGIALVTLYGYPALINAQADANIRNMERNMIVLQSDVNSLVYKSIPYKETTMQVSGGVLSVDPIISNFMIRDGNNDPLITYPDPDPAKQGTGAIQFISDTGEVSIALQNGAVVKHQSGGSVMLSKPRWFIDTNPSSLEETFVITLIQVDTSGSTLANSGISTVQMDIQPLLIYDPTPAAPGSGDETNIVDTPPASNEVKITIPLLDSKYRKALQNYFEMDLGMTTSDGITWTKTGIDRVIIKAWKINVINL